MTITSGSTRHRPLVAEEGDDTARPDERVDSASSATAAKPGEGVRLFDAALAAAAVSALMMIITMAGIALLDRRPDDAAKGELVVAVARYQAALDAHDITIVEPLLAPDFTLHNVDDGSRQDRRSFLAWARAIGGAYPNFAIGIDGITFVDDTATIRFHELTPFAADAHSSGTPATGTVVMRVANGMIVELWSNYDEFGLLHHESRSATHG